MAKKKLPELTDYEKIKCEFESDYDENELQERFENFESTVKHFKSLYNELVPQINEKLKNVKELNGMIVESALMGFLNNDAAVKLKEVKAVLAEQMESADGFKEKFTKEESLIKFYKENTHNKLFHYWKMFKAIDPATAPWLDWKRSYDQRIF